MGVKIVGGAFAASPISLVQHGRASTLESVIRGHHIYKHIWRPLVWEVLTLEREEGKNHDKFAVSLLKNATVVGHVPREFSRVLGTEGPSLVKLPVEESAVFVLFVLLHMFCSTRYALSSKFYKIYVINDKGNMRVADS